MTGTTQRIACVGAGYFSRFHLEAWARMPGAELAAICDHDEAKARGAAAEFGIGGVFTNAQAMLDAVQPTIVDITAPPAAHFEVIAAAAARRLSAICQKPFCRDRAEAERAVALAEQAGTPLIVHENFRFQPWHREIKRLVARGDLGEVYQASFRLRPGDGQGPGAYLDRQPYFRTMERFLVHETAIHFIDTFRFLFGEVDRVYASLRRLNRAIAGEDAGTLIFDHATGARTLFDGNRLVDHAARNRRLTMGEMLVEGSAGVLRLDGDGGLWRRDFGSNEERRHDYDWSAHGFGGDCVFALQRHVLEGLGGGTLENTGRAYLRNLTIEEAVYNSSRSGAAVDLG